MFLFLVQRYAGFPLCAKFPSRKIQKFSSLLTYIKKAKRSNSKLWTYKSIYLPNSLGSICQIFKEL